MAKQKNNILTLVAPFLAPIVKFKSLSIVGIIVAILAIIIVPLPSAVLDFSWHFRSRFQCLLF
ncbi:hypothetical protein VBZ67_09210 [Campylobacter concisus]